jgi:hypothetical protein
MKNLNTMMMTMKILVGMRTITMEIVILTKVSIVISRHRLIPYFIYILNELLYF